MLLCPVGIGGHTAAWHPQRLRKVPENAVTEIAKRISAGGKVAILDLGPERAASALYREAAKSFGDGLYLRMPDRQEATLNAVAQLLGRAPGSLGIDLEHTKTLISFGAPVLEGWSVPGRVMERWRSGALRIIQVEPRQSRTALAAETWIAVEPGGEAAFALKIAEGGAADLKIESPAVAIGNGGAEEPAVAALNVALGAIGREGGIVARTALPWKQEAAQELVSVPDHSIHVLFVDSSRAFDLTPWPVIQRKLAQGAMVVALAYREDSIAKHADFVIPVTAPFESLDDAGTAPATAVPSLALAPPLIDTPVTKQTGADVLNAVLQAAGKPQTGKLEDLLKERVAAIQAAKKGTVVAPDGTVTKISEDLWKKLANGSVWIGEASNEKLSVKSGAASQAARGSQPRSSDRLPYTLLIHQTPDDTLPLMTKLYQESGLFTPSTLARINPESAARASLKSGTRVVIETAHGSAEREVLVDPAVMPGVVEVAACASIADIATDGSAGDWRTVAAGLRRA